MAGRDAPAFFHVINTCGDILCQLRQVIKNIEHRYVKLGLNQYLTLPELSNSYITIIPLY